MGSRDGGTYQTIRKLAPKAHVLEGLPVEMGDAGSSELDIRKYAPGAAVKKGLSVTGSRAAESGDSVRRWLSANGLM